MPYLKSKYMNRVKDVMNTLETKIYEKKADLNTICYRTKEPVPFAQRADGTKKEIAIGDSWGELFDCAWFHFTGVVPACCNGQKVVLEIDVNGEALLVDSNGAPVVGLTNDSSTFDLSLGKPGKTTYIVSDCYDGDGTIDVWVDAGCNDLFGKLQEKGALKKAHISVQHDDVFDVFHDVNVLYTLLQVLDEKTAQYNQILFGLYEACLKLRTFDCSEIAQLKQAVASLYQKSAPSYLQFTAIGHAHIDLAWLWPIRETKRKGARTFATALYLMDKYPEYKFGASQPQLFQWIKEDYPALYGQVKQKVKEGRFELQGCMWVEADMNLAGGEALVRQILYGKRFFQKEFGIDVKNLWLPDVFGYNAALPQLLKKSGCDYFMTQKLSWSEHNKFPHQTFMWEGIDGTKIFTHMLPEETYNAPMAPDKIQFAEHNYVDSGVCAEALMLFGIGDGGGGPGMDHLERYRRVKNLQGLSNVTNDFAEPMLARLETKTRGRLPKWTGELYLEKHQGTYTTQAKNKLYNRLMEIALRELEFALVYTDATYPKEEIDAIWQEVLLYQFHDIIPGSSIKRVYDESVARYEILYKRVLELIDNAYSTASEAHTVFNSFAWQRTEIVSWHDEEYLVNVPALGATSTLTPAPTEGLSVAPQCIENNHLRVTFEKDGAICSLFDKRNNRETLAGRTNVFAVYEDTHADCWDISLDYVDLTPEQFTLTSMETKIIGAQAVCTQHYAYGQSTLRAVITLNALSERVDISLHADWHEKNKMLRTSVVANVVTNSASFEIQYGKLERPNNDNTLWQRAQFEVCAHKWVDLSQPDYGVALLNNCKYGFRVIDNIIDMNLLRSQNYPGNGADLGTHDIGYAIYPHVGNVAHGNVTQEAYNFNTPLVMRQGSSSTLPTPFATVEGEIIVESVKQAEDGNGIIVRAYEPYGCTAEANFTFAPHVTQIMECNLIEQNFGTVTNGNCITKTFKPFEIVTFRYTL